MKHLSDNNFNNNQLDNVPTPVNPGDAVNKEYADTKDDSHYLTPEMFGAIGDDANDDAPAFRAMFAVAKTTEQTIRLTAGKTYAFKSADPSDPTGALAVYMEDMKNLTVIGWGAVVKGYNSIQENPASPGAVFWIDSDSSDYVNTWIGVHIDLSECTPAVPNVMTIGGFSSRGPWNHNFQSCYFDHGLVGANSEGIVVGGGDQSIFLSAYSSAVISDSIFRGAPDLGIYLSASEGKNLKITGNHFYRCSRGIGLKRNVGSWIVQGNTFEECDYGIYTPVADGSSNNGGRHGIINGNIFKKIQSRPIDIDGAAQGTIISNNRIEDFNRLISNGGDNGIGEAVAAIRVRAPECQIFGNYIALIDWSSTSIAGRETTGIILAYNGNYGAGADWTTVHSNVIQGPTVGISVLTGVTAAREFNNHFRAVATPYEDAGTNTRGLMSRGTYTATNASAANLFISSAGDIYRSTSALKYKDDLQPLTDEQIDKFMQLRGVSYRSKCESDDPNQRFIGMIADEADELGLKELVSYDENGEVEGFQYERGVALLLEIVKRQEKRISDLETKLTRFSF